MIYKAVEAFDGMLLKDVISWNLVIGGLVHCGDLDLAEEYFRRMIFQDIVSWTIMISGLASAGRVVEARELFVNMPVRDVWAWNAMMVGYLENGQIEIAEDLFRKMPEHNFESWNELISGLVRSKRVTHAIHLFMEMPQKCQKMWNSILLELVRNGLIKQVHAIMEKFPYSDVVTWTNLIVGYFGLGEVGGTIQIFELMPARDATVWNATVFGLGENDQGEEGLKLFIRMKESGPSADKATFTSVLTICSDLPTLQFGKQTHADVIKSVIRVAGIKDDERSEGGDLKGDNELMESMLRRNGGDDTEQGVESVVGPMDDLPIINAILQYPEGSNGTNTDMETNLNSLTVSHLVNNVQEADF
nr:pentatricopeptide repeat-containing protein, mitochondrial [Quercus suber]